MSSTPSASLTDRWVLPALYGAAALTLQAAGLLNEAAHAYTICATVLPVPALPENDPMFLLGNVYICMHRPKKALRIFQQGERRFSQRNGYSVPAWWIAMANCYLLMGDREAAGAAMERARMLRRQR